MLRFSKVVFITFTFVAHSFATLAVMPDGNSDELAHQRNVYKALENMVAKPNSAEYRRLREQLHGYALEPYIEQITLKRYPYLANQQKIDDFLTKYEGTPLDRPLRHKWLEYLKKKDLPELYLEYFSPTANVELTCQYLAYQLQGESNQQQVFEQASKLWVVGRSQPNECDPVFDAWQKAGYRTEDKVLARMQLAGNGGNQTLLPYLKTLLPKSKQYLADLWLSVRRSPSFVSRLSRFPQKYPEHEMDILQYGLGRLVWRDEELALKTWQGVLKRYQVNPLRQREMASKFAIALTIDEHPKAEEWLEKANHQQADDQIFRWHLAHVLKSGDWQHALDVIDAIPKKASQDLSFRYWQARAFEQLNAVDNAQAGYDLLSKQRHYYGFLASGKLSKSPTIVDRPLEFDPQTLAQIANMPAAKRAYEFLQLERFTQARREWFYLQSQLTEEQKLASAVLADSWQWHDRAIYGFSTTGYLDDIKRRFPMAYRTELQNHSEANQVDPAWAFAIARRESSFMTDANSSAGARGLMQLLPGTARYLAKKRIRSNVLYNPDTNAEFGTQYLRYLLDKMDNNPVLATASYNAGWRRVQKWIPKDNAMPMDVWIETIPFKETRNYVKAVLAYRQIYAQQLGQPSTLFTELAKMQLGGNEQLIELN
ncbi:transglycosylase SLT domain-containing protein [Aliiglaciecola sp. M165]|uniref:transglycosylase SLT domain-containing protein n=1 Tax=Aliiglaciecola sp. M165 TaxID=2593649 RepID=UPI0021B0B5B9|nr:transglycosylase SLT domain-containing protein [Aliiglaciecola sp. M165]